MASEGKVGIAPDTNIIQRIRLNGGSNWPKMLAELIDNAIDAGASNVTLDFSSPNQLIVADDGRGCDDLLRMVIYGRRRDYDTTSVGMHGVGTKDAIIWIASEATVRSVCGDKLRTLYVNWDAVLETGQWEIDQPETAPTASQAGTRIKLCGFQRPAPSSWRDLERSLGVTFASAIQTGVSLLIYRPRCQRPVRVEAAASPDLADGFELDLDIGRGGRKALLKMGILQQPAQQVLQGMTVAMRGGRVLRSRTRIGLGGDPTPGLYGYAQIYPRGAWKVFANKDGIDERHEEELAAAISSHPKVAELVEKARLRGHDIRLDRVNEVLGLMSAEIAGAKKRKARRGPPENGTGTVIPTGTGSPHTRAARTQNGQTFTERREGRGGKISIYVQSYGEDGPLFNVSGPSVGVNSQHPFYSHAEGDMRIVAPLAVAYFTMHTMLGGQLVIPFPGVADDKQEELSKQIAGVMECLARAERNASEVQEPAC